MRFIGSGMTLMATCLFAASAPADVRIGQDESGRFWFVDDEGAFFLSLGVNAIGPGSVEAAERPAYDGVKARFGGDQSLWAADVQRILHGANINTIGAWSHVSLLETDLHQMPVIYISRWTRQRALNGFAPDYEEYARQKFQEILDEFPDQSNIIGYFLDNEIDWAGHRPFGLPHTYTLLEEAMTFDSGDPYRAAAVKFLQDRYGSLESFNAEWGQEFASWDDVNDVTMQSALNDETQAAREAFTYLAADRWYEVAARTVREMAPGKLILGTRHAGSAPIAVTRAEGKYVDVVSLNTYPYSEIPNVAQLEMMFSETGKPIMIGEFGWRARENRSGNPNSKGTGLVVETQADRAALYSGYTRHLFELPFMVGSHWFCWSDQPPGGRFDGEDSNYGLVDIHHDVYEEVQTAMRETIPQLTAIHSGTTRSLPPVGRVEKPPSYTASPVPGQSDVLRLMIAERGVNVSGPAAPYVEISRQSGDLQLRYDTGDSWGFHVEAIAPPDRAVTAGEGPMAFDLSGYDTLVLKAQLPAGTRFTLLIDEAGVARPWQSDYDTRRGDDGEAWTSQLMVAREGSREYRIALNHMEPRIFYNAGWGNQGGNNRLDIHAVSGVRVAVSGGQGSGEMVLEGLWLE